MLGFQLRPGRTSPIGGYRGHSLGLDFAAQQYAVGPTYAPPQPKTFDELVTFTRASGGGRFNDAGQYEWLANNVARFDYDPVTRQPRGLLIEEQRTNLLTYSQQFDNAAWVKSSSTVSQNSAVAPDGSASADKLIATSAGSLHTASMTLTTSASVHTFSLYAKAGGYTSVLIYNTTIGSGRSFDLVSGSGGYTLGTIALSSIDYAGAGWYRVSVTVTATAAPNTWVVYVATSASNNGWQFSGNDVDGIYVWGAQLETGAFPTSYIPTTTAQVTRAADVASVNVLSPWYRQDEGTLFTQFNAFGTSGSATVAGLGNGVDASDRAQIYLSPTTSKVFVQNFSGNIAQLADTQAGSYVQGAPSKAVLALKSRDFGWCFSGGAVGTSSDGIVGVKTRLAIGKGAWYAPGYLNGHIREIRYYPRRLGDSELQQITT